MQTSTYYGSTSAVTVTFSGNMPVATEYPTNSDASYAFDLGYQYRRVTDPPAAAGWSCRPAGSTDPFLFVFSDRPGNYGQFFGPNYVYQDYITGTEIGVYYVSAMNLEPRLLSTHMGSFYGGGAADVRKVMLP